jgi:hypothetical protein
MIDAIPLLLAPEGYQISRSVRLRSSASAYLSRTFGSATNTLVWTWSAWFKRGALAGNGPYLLEGYSNGTNRAGIIFSVGEALSFFYQSGGSVVSQLTTTQVFRDPSAWYHVVVAYDATQATASNRLKFYVNGTQVTSFSTATYPSLSQATWINTSSAPHTIGVSSASATTYFDGYLTEVNFIDGQALTPASFGEINPVTGVWQPKKYTGTYGTNGFYLNFSDNSNNTAATIGKDYSGNGNNWTPNNISVTAGATYDSMLDVPTQWADGGNGRGNYAVINPLATPQLNSLTNGNLTAVASQTLRGGGNATMAVRTGQWYWEHNVGTSGEFFIFGIRNTSGSLADFPGADSNGYGYYGQNGNKYTGGSATAYGATFASGDVIGVAFDADAGTLTFYKNNVSQGTAFSSIPSGDWFPAIGDGSTVITGSTVNINFGQRPFAYTPPTGFRALNTQNLPTPTILKGNQYMDATLYTGTGAARSVTNSGAMQPDLVWVKGRSTAYSHYLADSVRGTARVLSSDSTAAEINSATTVTAFNSNGFSLGTEVGLNNNGTTFVGWQWKEGPTQGFDIVTFAGSGSSPQTINHSLGVAPKMMIVRPRNAVDAWYVYHASLGNTGGVVLNGTNAFSASAGYWNNTSPTSSAFTLGSFFGSTANFVAYLFSEVAGFSRIGSYTGNGSTDGPFCFTGFLPRWLMIKRTDSATNADWVLLDTARDSINVSGNILYANLSNAETTFGSVDFLSNGFKVRQSSGLNVSSGTYIYAAFASNPFKHSLAR